MTNIPLMRNTFLNEKTTKENLSAFILGAERLSMGPMCKEFENKFAQWQQRKAAVLFNSGASSNLAILQSLKNLGRLKDGDKIAFSSLTWSTNVMPIIQLGFVPVALDVDVNTINSMSHNLLDRLESTKISALFLTNTLGFAGDLAQIREICSDRDIILLEDNCESLGSKLVEGRTGNFSLMSSFSFFVSHHMSTIEGGMVCSDDLELVDMLRLVRANGWGRDVSNDREKSLRESYGISDFKAPYSFYDLGFNLRPTEITGFLGIEQLQYLDANLEQRATNYKTIEKAIINNDDLISVKHDHMEFIAPFAIPVICRDKDIRDKYLKKCSLVGIEVRPLIAGNIQRQPFYGKYVSQMYDLKGTEFLDSAAFYCGNCPEFTAEEVDVIASCLSK